VNRAGATVSIGLGVVALLLSVLGIYGTMAFMGWQRRREIGVRLALGSPSALSLGVAGGLLLRSLVRGVVLADPLALIVPPLLLGGAAYIACVVPAWRASRVAPVQALREE
jgi:ABC-type antimicrobial peptide transport system permease subunit